MIHAHGDEIMYYVVHRTNEYLKHHGIEGQKWGVRNGPPYPLKSNNSSSGLRMNLQFFARKPEDYDTIPVSERVLSDVRYYIKRRKETDPIVHIPHGNVTLVVDNTKIDNPRVIDFEPISDAITGLYERIKNDE